MADDPELAGVKAELVEALEKWRVGTEDPLLKGGIPDMLNPWPEKATY